MKSIESELFTFSGQWIVSKELFFLKEIGLSWRKVFFSLWFAHSVILESGEKHPYLGSLYLAILAAVLVSFIVKAIRHNRILIKKLKIPLYKRVGPSVVSLRDNKIEFSQRLSNLGLRSHVKRAAYSDIQEVIDRSVIIILSGMLLIIAPNISIRSIV